MSSDNQQPEVMTGESLDISEQRKRELKQLFPGVFTETTNDKGEVVETIDFERLKAELGTFSDVYEGRRERYGMEWPGKRDCMRLIQEPSRATLKPVREESVDFDTTQNLFIEGDNLEVLKLLQKSYYGKVKMIYIDPPYNTGKEFIYPDKYSETLETYLEYAGLIDDEGKKFASNTPTEGRFHTRWINMMYPRLYLARNLLRDDGVIFISIDDSELDNLRKICDEVFGEENGLGVVARATGQTTGQDSGGLGSSFDFILVYAKDGDVDLSGLPLTDKDKKRFENKDEKGFYSYDQMRKTGSNDRREDRPNMYYPVIDPDGSEVFPIAPAGYEGRWRFERNTYEKYRKDGLILWKKSKRGDDEIWWPYVKYYLEGRTKRPSPLWNDLEGNKKAARDLRALFDGNKVFDFPKPIGMLKRCMQIAPNASDADIVMDFFAGSCSLPHAVMELNSEDGGRRRYIAVQLPEKIDSDSEAYKCGYKTISDIGKDRIRKAANDIGKRSEGQLGLDDVGNIDLGFKVYKLDQSNFKQWQTTTEELTSDQLSHQLYLHTDHVDPYSTQEEIIYELLLKSGFELTERLDTLVLEGKQVFSIADGALLICLEDELNAELIDAVADLEPMQFICLDKGFKGNDQLKANAVQTFKSRSQNAETEMVFKVV